MQVLGFKGRQLCGVPCNKTGAPYCPADPMPMIHARPRCTMQDKEKNRYCALSCQQDKDCGPYKGARCSRISEDAYNEGIRNANLMKEKYHWMYQYQIATTWGVCTFPVRGTRSHLTTVIQIGFTKYMNLRIEMKVNRKKELDKGIDRHPDVNFEDNDEYNTWLPPPDLDSTFNPRKPYGEGGPVMPDEYTDEEAWQRKVENMPLGPGRAS